MTRQRSDWVELDDRRFVLSRVLGGPLYTPNDLPVTRTPGANDGFLCEYAVRRDGSFWLRSLRVATTDTVLPSLNGKTPTRVFEALPMLNGAFTKVELDEYEYADVWLPVRLTGQLTLEPLGGGATVELDFEAGALVGRQPQPWWAFI